MSITSHARHEAHVARRFNRRPDNRFPLTASQREDMIKKHVMIDREKMSKELPDTKRFVCFGCKFATDDQVKSDAHQDWVRSRFEEDAKRNAENSETYETAENV